MIEVSLMARDIRRLTIALVLAATGISVVIWKDGFSTIGLGIIIGGLCGLLGFSMINKMSADIEHASNPKTKGNISYMLRIVIYTLIFALSALRGINLIALLAGMLCHKAAIMLYVFLHRKEVD